MTEQPAEPTTEQAWLGNRPAAYLPGGHRIQARHAADLPGARRSPLVSKFLGAVDSAFDKADQDLTPRRATDISRVVKPHRTTLGEQAEISATNAVTALSSGELDEGIAWLQSALAFAENHRHATRHEGTAQ